jgi:CoA:oxalate CoA-transferase
MAGPLAGVRVLDLTRFLAGPYCTMMLADYGADVVKLESPEGREFRSPGAARDSYFFLSSNRGKRSATLDLRRAEARDLFVRILPHFDVLVENYRPDVMERFGLSAEKLVDRFPRLVYCGISGFGPDGPYRLRPGFDQIAQGMSGFMSLTGTAEMGPTRAGIAIGDVLAGIFAAHGIQLALLERARTGRGQIVHTSLLESMIAVLAWGAGMYFESGRAPGPAGQHHPLTAPNGRFSGVLERRANRDALTRAIEEVLRERDVADWVTRINDAGVPCGPVLDVAQMFADPQVLAREMLVELPHPELGTFKTTGLPVKLSRTPGAIERRPPLHGEHTDEVLRECGISDAEIAALRAAKAL